MNAVAGHVPQTPSRSGVLLAAALAAVAVHAAVLLGIQWTSPPAVDFTAQDQGIAIDLAPVPAKKIQTQAAAMPEAQSAAEPEPLPVIPEERMEPVPEPVQVPAARSGPEKVRPRKPVVRRAAAAPSAGEPQPTAAPAVRAKTASPSAVSSNPEPAANHANRKPAYPELARRRGQEGLVLLLARVDAAGELLDLTLEKSSGHSLLDEAALKAVRQWRFKPGLQGGLPVMGTVVVPVEFVLKAR